MADALFLDKTKPENALTFSGLKKAIVQNNLLTTNKHSKL